VQLGHLQDSGDLAPEIHAPHYGTGHTGWLRNQTLQHSGHTYSQNSNEPSQINWQAQKVEFNLQTHNHQFQYYELVVQCYGTGLVTGK